MSYFHRYHNHNHATPHVLGALASHLSSVHIESEGKREWSRGRWGQRWWISAQDLQSVTWVSASFHGILPLPGSITFQRA